MASTFHDVLIRVAGETDDASRELETLAAELEAFDQLDADAKLDVDDRQMRAKLKKAEQDLRFYGKINEDAVIDVDIDDALAGVRRARAELAALGRQKTTVEVDVDRDSDLGGGLLTGIRRRFAELSEGLSGARVNLGPFSVSLSVLARLFGFLVPLVVGASAAIIALAGSFSQAAAGAGVLAIAAGAVLTPIVAIAAAAISRFTQITEVLEEVKQATEGVRAASRALESAERNLTDAERDALRAQEALTLARREARRQAEDELEAAIAAVTEAERQQTLAKQDLLSAEEALTDAREAATRALQDQRIAADEAVLGEKDARDALQDARRELQALERDPSATRDEVSDQRREVERAEIDLRKARETNKRAAEDLTEAEKKGVDGSDQVRAARSALEQAAYDAAQADVAHTDAIDRLNAARDVEIRKMPAVVAARRAAADARRGEADAEREVTRASRELELAQRKQTKALREQAALAPAAAEALRRASSLFGDELQSATRGGTDAIFRGLARGLRTLGRGLRPLEDNFTRLGQAIGGSLGDAAEELTSPAWTDFWEMTTDAATRIVPDLLEGLLDLMAVFRDLAEAAQPFLEAGVEAFRDWTADLAAGTEDADGLSSSIGNLVGQLRSWWELGRQLGRVMLALFGVSADEGQGMVDTLAEGAEKLADWINSADGQERVRQFFDRVIPAIDSAVDLIGKLVGGFIEFGELVAPSVEIILDVVGELADLLNAVLETLNSLPGPLQGIVGAFLLLKGPGAALGIMKGLWSFIKLLAGTGGISKVIDLLKKMSLVRMAGGAAGGLFDVIGGATRGLGRGIAKFGSTVARWGKTIALRAGPYGLALAAVLEYGDDLGRELADGLGLGPQEGEAIQKQQLAIQSDIAQVWGGLGPRLRKTFSKLNLGSMLYKSQTFDEVATVFREEGNAAGREYIRTLAKSIREDNRAKREAIKNAKDLAEGAIEEVRKRQREAQRAGELIGNAIAKGIELAQRALRKVSRKAAGAIRDMLPGSEPKDPTSPLRNLGRVGDAIIGNIERGLRRAGPRLAASLRGGLSGGRSDLTRQLARAAAGGPRGPGGDFTQHNHFTVPGGGSPDTETAGKKLGRGMRKKGWPVT